MTSQDDPAYEAYLRERTALDQAELAVSERFDRWILTLSGGALGLSVTFLEKLAPHPKPSTKSLLIAAWSLLLLSLLLALISLLTSQSATRKVREQLDQGQRISTPGDRSDKNPYAVATNVLNISSMGLFTVVLLSSAPLQS